ncbi:hypothetical protein Bca4012_076693 [Brassica carinata]|uniref:HR-like lesion-inducer n=2 Tax=Brassica oleracea TaxID=3712 RepID=A0A0D3D5K9_BRAOL|nr:PREDICTED: uncharacterized protein LOC106305185 [Brassica oleracea var. oleracea]XP_013597005.1 PREDICTED: uncharacterized protein LOC106305185 [Brassica oleracea var. oleracea]VDD36374.1 unnamed protein product [Brassica oleracea]
MSNVKNIMCTTLTRSMPAIAFFGRMAFALVFIISAIQDYADHFGGGGGPLEKTVGPAVNVMTKYGSKVLTFYTGMQVVAFDVRLLEFSLITAKGTAALWFIFGQSMPAYFLLATQMLSTVIPFPTNLNDFTQNLTLMGALLYYIGLKHSIDNLEEGEKSKEKEKEDDKPSTSKSKGN